MEKVDFVEIVQECDATKVEKRTGVDYKSLNKTINSVSIIKRNDFLLFEEVVKQELLLTDENKIM